jgi:hypothetical protein
MSKSSYKMRLDALKGWLEQTKKNSKYGKPKRTIIEDEVDLIFTNFKRRKR